MTPYRTNTGRRELTAVAVLATVALLGATGCAANGDVRATFTPAASPGGSPHDGDEPAADPAEPEDDAEASAPEESDDSDAVVGADGEVPEPLDKPDPRAGGPFDDPPTGDPAPRPAPRAYTTDAVAGGSDSEANLVGVEAQRRDGWEEIIFTFVDTDAPPAYTIDYVDAIRPHDEADPIPLNGAAFLQVDFSGVDPTRDGVMAVPSDVRVGQPGVQEIVLAENIAGELRFGISLAERERFQVRELADPTRLVIQVAG